MSNYILISKVPKNNDRMANNTVRVRVNNGGMTIAANVARRFLAHAYETKFGKSVKLRLEVDKDNGKIRLAASDDGFSFAYAPSGSLCIGSHPKQLRAAEMPVGDYISRNNGNTFVLVK